jgi:hypothetical protein
MPKVHASNEFVWRTFINGSGWSNDGLVFIMGMLNGGEFRPLTMPDQQRLNRNSVRGRNTGLCHSLGRGG